MPLRAEPDDLLMADSVVPAECGSRVVLRGPAARLSQSLIAEEWPSNGRSIANSLVNITLAVIAGCSPSDAADWTITITFATLNM